MTDRDPHARHDLAERLRDPALALEPSPDLVEGVRRRARRTRRRRAAAPVVLALGALALATGGLPALTDREPDVTTPAAAGSDVRVPEATTPVVRLERVNGGDVVTFYVGGRWCTASLRTERAQACSRPVGAQVPPFAFLQPVGSESLTVDDERLVAGLLGTGVDAVRVELSDGTRQDALTVRRDGFVRPVWWLRVPPGLSVAELTARDATGRVVEARTA